MPVSSPRKSLAYLLALIMIASLSACVPASSTANASSSSATAATAPVIVETDSSGNTIEYRLPENPQSGEAPAAAEPPATPTFEPGAAPEPVKPAAPLVWVSPELPAAFLEQMKLPANLPHSEDRSAANVWIEYPIADLQLKIDYDWVAERGRITRWIYAVAAPFPTVQDAVSLKALQAAWHGKPGSELSGKPLLVTAETRAALESLWGTAADSGLREVDPAALLDTAWQEKAFAIIPFEEIQPRWKILRIRTDSLTAQSPLNKDFDPASYPLAVSIWIDGTSAAFAGNPSLPVLPTNRDPKKLTVLTMTGVTALSRHIGERMENKGLTYPARDIRDWLVDADLTHISNEVSFYKDCPKPGPDRADMRFCSNPKYIKLLEDVGADIIELTGNHNLDWGFQPFFDSLNMYRERGWGVYGGGANLKEAQKPLLVEHNGNRLAFLGCSPAGPENVWARDDAPGSAPCNYERMEQAIVDLRAQGYLPVITLQAVETDTYVPTPAQAMPKFRELARAGAVIVSGSQSHVPQTMTLVGDRFVHYGLGNLFFDQMKPEETRQEFVDRHVFYNGKYLGVELLTALLEDYSRPRPMTSSERDNFLTDIFSLSDWSGE